MRKNNSGKQKNIMGGQIQIKITFSEAVREFLKNIDVGGSPPKKEKIRITSLHQNVILLDLQTMKEDLKEIVFKREERILE